MSMSMVADYFSRDFAEVLLAAGGDADVSPACDVETYRYIGIGIEATTVSSGASLLVEAQMIAGGAWYPVTTTGLTAGVLAITADGNTYVQFTGPFYAVRVSVPHDDYTDGVYAVTLRALR
jgi:hypothetical protein